MRRAGRSSSCAQRFDPLSSKHALLTAKQSRKVPGRPEMMHLFAHYLAERAAAERNGTRPRVYALAITSVNFRQEQYMIDPRVDLAALPPWSWPNRWVVPLLPRGSFDWRVVPWPMCAATGDEAASFRQSLYEMYHALRIEQAWANFGREPDDADDVLVNCSKVTWRPDTRGGGD